MNPRLTALLLLMSAVAFASGNTSAYDAVDPFIGTAGEGNVFPGATVPFGMMQWSPDTRADGWYHFGDKTIRGFSLTHISGAGCPIYADVPILPWAGEVTSDPSSSPDYALAFEHSGEVARPGFYSVKSVNGIGVLLTTAVRSGIGTFTFPAGTTRTFLFKAGESATIAQEKQKNDTSAIEIRGNDTVVGTVHSGGFCDSDSKYTLYFAAKFNSPFSAFGTWGERLNPGTRSVSANRAGAYVSFPGGSDPIILKVGISFVSVENAEANLKSEIPSWSFEVFLEAAKFQWNKVFDRVETEGGTLEQRTIFYTGLYHMLLSPNIFNDVTGDYIGFDGKVRRLGPKETQYANFSDWDTYRNLVQFHSLLFPEQTSQMMQSLVRDAEQSGWLPRWPVANDVSYVMGGDSSAILLSSGYAFGANAFDHASAAKFMLKGATQPGTGLHGGSQRPGLAEYLSKGYIPAGDNNESGASVTVEYASADFAISTFLEAQGDKDNAAKLLRSSQNWRSLFDAESGFIRPRGADGQFIAWDPDLLLPHHTNWDKNNQLGFEEGSTWQYTFMIPHNYAGLFKAMGGNEKVLPKLDKFFQKLSGWGVPTFTVTNEPDFCAPYAYVWTGNAWKTQEVVDRIRRETFTTKPDGLPGNDDLGATSGVYVWNALGMYPVIPGVGGMVLGTPMFPKATVRLGNGSTIEISTEGQGVFVRSVSLNEKPLSGTWLPLNRLRSGRNQLKLALGQEPNRTWATDPQSFPPSFDSSLR